MINMMLCFGSGIIAGFLLFAIIDNKNSILIRMENLRIENYNLKKDLKEKEGFMNALIDDYCEQGVIDDAE